jgi:hypothetical protein
MTEPIKLPPAWNHPNETPESYAAKCVQHATATLSAEIERLREMAGKWESLFQAQARLSEVAQKRAEKARAEVERLRAELARLTTLRPHACDDEYDGEKLFWGKDGDSWICDPLFVHSTHWTPLPDVKEPK